MALWILSGTTRVSRYQKKHSPTHTHRGLQSSLLLSLSTTIHGILPIQSTCFTVFFHNLSPSFLWSTSWPGSLHFILHTFLHPIIISFSQHMPILSGLVSIMIISIFLYLQHKLQHLMAKTANLLPVRWRQSDAYFCRSQ